MDAQRKRDYERCRYANMSIEARQKKIQQSIIGRKKKKQITNLAVASSSTLLNSDGIQNEIATESNVDYISNISELHILKEPHFCLHCNAKIFQFEPPTFCCYKGDVILPSTSIPSDLYELFTSTSSESNEFRKNIRAYNSIFAFTSFGAHIDQDLANSKKGVYTFRAQGQIYHALPPITKDSRGPHYFQLYIYDTDLEAINRMGVVSNIKLSENLVNKLMTILHVNPYSQFFRSLHNLGPLQNLQIKINVDINLDQRVYNAPSVSQVGAIWIEPEGSSDIVERDIILNSHSGTYQKIKHYFGCYDPLQYPLLFPYGEVGWHQNINRDSSRRTNILHDDDHLMLLYASEQDILSRELEGIIQSTKHRVSCRQYYSYKLQIRQNYQSVILWASRLLHQYVVDMYVKIETSRLDFYRRNQHTIRSELYKGIVDSVAVGETSGNNIGKKIILPASFIGGPRDMRRRYLDAMALVQRYGKPDLFITMTCNPDWFEIKNELLPGQTPQDRPDLTTRIFRAKLYDLKDQLFKKSIFGDVAAYIYVIEFQKRGLPHAHLLLILKHSSKITTTDQFDKFVSAELPNPFVYAKLHESVVKHMIHGPCGNLNKTNSCMKKGVCKYKYPRSFSQQTSIGNDSYPIYRRRDDGKQIKVRNCVLDNRWVIPYNPYLLSRYNCHINVEICSGIKAVKYIYKYVYKGHDKISVSLSHQHKEGCSDEIQAYQDGRWVSAPEALWRIFEFDLNQMYPSICHLQLHLEDMHVVYYKENQDVTVFLSNEKSNKTMLTEFFDLNKRDTDANHYLYKEIPEKYTWDKVKKIWKKRQQLQQIGRINTTNPSEGERYYLRLLLNHVYGPTSFSSLLQVNGFRCSTFKEAAEKHGLLETDNYISDCLNDASVFHMPFQLRQLFATILVYCEPTNIRELWNSFYVDLSHDYQSISIDSEELCLRKTLSSISICLHKMGRSIDEFDIPQIPEESPNNIDSLGDFHNKDIIEELNVRTPVEDVNAKSLLNTEQKYAYETIMHRVIHKQSGIFFIDGPAGTGKTFIYRALLATLRMNSHIAIATATSGVAASIMPGGRTAHSRFKIPINSTETTSCNIPKQSSLADLLRRSSLLIWDEAPMVKRTAIETLDRSLRDIMNNSNYFGGKVVVFGGDFRQVLPVIRHASRFETIKYSIARSYLWERIEIFNLKENMRSICDPFYSAFILRIGNGDEIENEDGLIKIPDNMLIKYTTDEESKSQLIDAIFPNLYQNATCSEYITSRAILTTKNEDVDKLNQKLIDCFSGNETIYYSFDSVIDDQFNLYQPEFLNSLTPNGLPPHRLVLKENCPIMLLRNLDPSIGLCNGTRMICKSFKKNVILAEISMGEFSGSLLMIPRIPLCPSDDEALPFKFHRKQFPIRLSFAMTINKSQGQMIPNVGVYLPHDVFSHGQLYVALSRGISINQTKILIMPTNSSGQDSYTKNVVYKEILTSYQ